MCIYTWSGILKACKFIKIKMKILFININLIKLKKIPSVLTFTGEDQKYLHFESGFDNLLNLARTSKLYCQKNQFKKVYGKDFIVKVKR